MKKSHSCTTLSQALAAVLLAATIGLWSAAVAAAQADPDSAAQTSEEAEGSQGEDVEDTTGRPSSEVFIPTEEISEDFAVSFPVDI